MVPMIPKLTVCKACIEFVCRELICNDLTCSKVAQGIALLLALLVLSADRLYGCVCFSSLRLSAPPPLAGRIIEINFITTCQVPLVREQLQPESNYTQQGRRWRREPCSSCCISWWRVGTVWQFKSERPWRRPESGLLTNWKSRVEQALQKPEAFCKARQQLGLSVLRDTSFRE